MNAGRMVRWAVTLIGLGFIIGLGIAHLQFLADRCPGAMQAHRLSNGADYNPPGLESQCTLLGY